jgi:hypothetical protein
MTHDRSNLGETPQRQQQDYYAVLGLQLSASFQEIRQAYRELSKRYHPDTTILPPELALAKFQQLKEAYDTLSDPQSRLRYDRYRPYLQTKTASQGPKASQRSSSAPYPARTPASPSFQSPKPPEVRYDRLAYVVGERSLSAGEVFALFILGLTFIGCIVLAITLGLARGELRIDPPGLSPTVSETIGSDLAASPQENWSTGKAWAKSTAIVQPSQSNLLREEAMTA